jgi:hypothetical protein
VETAADAARKEAAKQAVILVFMVATVLVVMAIHSPDSLRTLRMRSAAASNRLLACLSSGAGRICMKIELMTGVQEYEVPYRLSLLRDMASLMYRRDSDGGPGY